MQEEKAKIKHLEEKFSFARYELIIECEPEELQFYLYLKLYAINKHSAFPSQETIERDLEWKEQKVRYWVKRMAEKGRLKYAPGGGRKSSLYDITWYDTLNLRGRKNPVSIEKSSPIEKHSPMENNRSAPLKTIGEQKEIERKDIICIFDQNKNVVLDLFEQDKIPIPQEGVYDYCWVLKKADKSPHLFFIALYWKKRDYKFDNPTEASGELMRLTRKASEYCSKYTIKKFQSMLDWVEADADEKGYNWAFETLDKKLAEFNLNSEPVTI